MKILNKIVDFIKSLISKVRKPVHVEVTVNSEKVEEKPAENVAKPVEKTEKTDKPVKRRGRPRKVKSE